MWFKLFFFGLRCFISKPFAASFLFLPPAARTSATVCKNLPKFLIGPDGAPRTREAEGASGCVVVKTPHLSPPGHSVSKATGCHPGVPGRPGAGASRPPCGELSRRPPNQIQQSCQFMCSRPFVSCRQLQARRLTRRVSHVFHFAL